MSRSTSKSRLVSKVQMDFRSKDVEKVAEKTGKKREKLTGSSKERMQVGTILIQRVVKAGVQESEKGCG